MHIISRYERKVDILERQMDSMEDSNDGSIQWVNDKRELMKEYMEAVDELSALRQSGERREY